MLGQMCRSTLWELQMTKYVVCLGKKLWHYLDDVQPKDIVLGIIECEPKHLENNLSKFEKAYNKGRDNDCYEPFDNDELVYVEVTDEWQITTM